MNFRKIVGAVRQLLGPRLDRKCYIYLKRLKLVPLTKYAILLRLTRGYFRNNLKHLSDRPRDARQRVRPGALSVGVPVLSARPHGHAASLHDYRARLTLTAFLWQRERGVSACFSSFSEKNINI